MLEVVGSQAKHQYSNKIEHVLSDVSIIRAVQYSITS